MPYQQITDLPQDVRDKLSEDAQHIYIAAFNSFLENSGDEQAATQVAWNTITCDENYAQSQDGKWHRLPEGGGKSPNALANMPNN